jgi:hypothetical protein
VVRLATALTAAAPSQGTPEFHAEVNTCHYEIHWTTAAACRVEDRVANGCILRDPETNSRFDFTGLQGSLKASDGATYEIRPCSPFACGSDQAAYGCQTTASSQSFSLGQSGGLEIVDGEIVLRTVGGTPCHNNQYPRSSITTFECPVRWQDVILQQRGRGWGGQRRDGGGGKEGGRGGRRKGEVAAEDKQAQEAPHVIRCAVAAGGRERRLALLG